MRFQSSICVFVALSAGSAQAQEVLPECEVARAVKQASLYVEDGQLAAARGELEMALRTRRGPETPELWFAYGLVSFEQGDFDAAGAAVARIYAFNEAGTLEEVPDWAERFLARYELAVGTLVLEDTEPTWLSFEAEYVSGSQAERARVFLAREQGVLTRSTLDPIRLPVGIYRLGEARVEVRPSGERPVVVPVARLGDREQLSKRAASAPSPAPFPVIQSPYLERCEERPLPRNLGAAPPSKSGGSAWPWVIGGLVLAAAAGGAVAAAVALDEPDWRLDFGRAGNP